MAKNTIETIASQIAKTCINAIENAKQFSILQEMHGFDGIINFPQTIKDLILLDQMDIFGISKEMQIILKHINQLGMLAHIKTISRHFQSAYEKHHNRFVVIVSIGKACNTSEITQIIEDLRHNFTTKHDFIFKQSPNAGIIVNYQGKTTEYTAISIAKMLKAS